eukprot:TRINITY_DN17315_c0_g1_i1.p1 TRINITY_DN17315_c0_g1~~TRINITY_DN17315_c0_g1_i1.p1  ORF type:complete len:152 (+),score=34.08 TRINITY_DN17315_c0_g1_i1:189-644(+)
MSKPRTPDSKKSKSRSAKVTTMQELKEKTSEMEVRMLSKYCNKNEQDTLDIGNRWIDVKIKSKERGLVPKNKRDTEKMLEVWLKMETRKKEEAKSKEGSGESGSSQKSSSSAKKKQPQSDSESSSEEEKTKNKTPTKPVVSKKSKKSDSDE